MFFFVKMQLVLKRKLVAKGRNNWCINIVFNWSLYVILMYGLKKKEKML